MNRNSLQFILQNPPISQDFLDRKYRHNMAFLTRFKAESNDLLYFTTTPTPIKNWQFRARAAYDAVVALATALRMAKEETGNLPDPIESCSETEKSGLNPYLRRVCKASSCCFSLLLICCCWFPLCLFSVVCVYVCLSVCLFLFLWLILYHFGCLSTSFYEKKQIS